jgi:hypothetical protein
MTLIQWQCLCNAGAIGSIIGSTGGSWGGSAAGEAICDGFVK